jgi:hypothetical protein
MFFDQLRGDLIYQLAEAGTRGRLHQGITVQKYLERIMGNNQMMFKN